MNVVVNITKTFKQATKPLIKKYPSLLNDLAKLEQDLCQKPQLGTPLGNEIYKIRLQIKSKNKGKSGGARIITLLETIEVESKNMEYASVIVNLITIYDKSDIATLTNKEIQNLILSSK